MCIKVTQYCNAPSSFHHQKARTSDVSIVRDEADVSLALPHTRPNMLRPVPINAPGLAGHRPGCSVPARNPAREQWPSRNTRLPHQAHPTPGARYLWRKSTQWLSYQPSNQQPCFSYWTFEREEPNPTFKNAMIPIMPRRYCRCVLVHRSAAARTHTNAPRVRGTQSSPRVQALHDTQVALAPTVEASQTLDVIYTIYRSKFLSLDMISWESTIVSPRL